MSLEWSLWLCLRVSGIAVGISAAIGLWLAFLWTDRRWPASLKALPVFLKALFAAPVVVYYVGGRAGYWSVNEPGLVAAGVVSAAPLFLVSAVAAFAGRDPALVKAARSLGASDWLLFSRVHLPLAARPLLAGAAGAFLAVFVELALAWWLAKGIFS